MRERERKRENKSNSNSRQKAGYAWSILLCPCNEMKLGSHHTSDTKGSFIAPIDRILMNWSIVARSEDRREREEERKKENGKREREREREGERKRKEKQERKGRLLSSRDKLVSETLVCFK